MAIEDRGQDFQYDVSLSFAGEDRGYVDEVASCLREAGVRVFYDSYERVQLWGKDLYEHLDFIYSEAARYCVMFVSEHYAKKLWTNHERRSAQERALRENHEYVLPARFDATDVPGLRDTVGYVDLRETSPAELAELIRAKLGPRIRASFFPPVPDKLFAALQIEDEELQENVAYRGLRFMRTLERMTNDERKVVYTILLQGCPAELPENVHMSLNLVRREIGFSRAKILRLLKNIGPLGFYPSLRESHYGDGHDLDRDDELIVLEWHDMSTDLEIDEESNSTDIAEKMLITATEDYCSSCTERILRELDFSGLANATSDAEEH
jgi:TIR domain